MKITNFGRAEHRLLSAAIEKAIQQVAADHGVTLKAEGGQYGTVKGMIRIAVEVETKAGEMTHAEKEYRNYAHWLGLDPNGFGKTVIVDGKPFKVSGLKPSAPKFNVLAVCARTGKTFKLMARSIQAQIPAPKVAA